MAKKKFVCSICGHVHEGNSAPDTCPVCQASSSAFTEDRSGQKKGWMHNPNSNTYIIVYSTVMVVIVATLLAVASLSLQKRQAENELQEKKSNILQSLGYSPDENPQEFDRALADFDNQVKSFVLDADGVKTETPSKEVFAMLATNQNIRDNYDAKRLILFQTEDGRVVIPLIGMGLWGDIWGWIPCRVSSWPTRAKPRASVPRSPRLSFRRISPARSCSRTASSYRSACARAVRKIPSTR